MNEFTDAITLFKEATPFKDYLPELQTPISNREQLIGFLLPYVRNLLDFKMDELLKIMYRVDVDETKFKNTLASAEPEKLAEKITELLVDRQLQKIFFRRKYSSS